VSCKQLDCHDRTSCCQPSTELPGHLQSHYVCLLAAGVLANIVMPTSFLILIWLILHVAVAALTGNLHSSHTRAFVMTHRVGVCKGPYPQSFVRAWKAWDKRNKSENDPIDGRS